MIFSVSWKWRNLTRIGLGPALEFCLTKGWRTMTTLDKRRSRKNSLY
uniref:Uncharacterized protein n=1 Tax=Anguilla anguilla TaxID=7936 RepID=A0A0E9RJW0_ANGAN